MQLQLYLMTLDSCTSCLIDCVPPATASAQCCLAGRARTPARPGDGYAVRPGEGYAVRPPPPLFAWPWPCSPLYPGCPSTSSAHIISNSSYIVHHQLTSTSRIINSSQIIIISHTSSPIHIVSSTHILPSPLSKAPGSRSGSWIQFLDP